MVSIKGMTLQQFTSEHVLYPIEGVYIPKL